MRMLLALIALLAAAAPAAADDPRPAATKRFMRDLVAGRVPWTTVLDAQRGVAYIGYTTGDTDEPDPPWGRRLCEAKARALLRTRRRELADNVAADEAFRCSNRGGKPTCWIGEAGEWSGTLRFEFRVDGDHLVLDTLAQINSAYPPDDQERVLDRMRTRAARTCAP